MSTRLMLTANYPITSVRGATWLPSTCTGPMPYRRALGAARLAAGRAV